VSCSAIVSYYRSTQQYIQVRIVDPSMWRAMVAKPQAPRISMAKRGTDSYIPTDGLQLHVGLGRREIAIHNIQQNSFRLPCTSRVRSRDDLCVRGPGRQVLFAPEITLNLGSEYNLELP